MEQAPDILRAEAEPVGGRREQPQHIVMGLQGALGLPVEPEV